MLLLSYCDYRIADKVIMSLSRFNLPFIDQIISVIHLISLAQQHGRVRL